MTDPPGKPFADRMSSGQDVVPTSLVLSKVPFSASGEIKILKTCLFVCLFGTGAWVLLYRWKSNPGNSFIFI